MLHSTATVLEAPGRGASLDQPPFDLEALIEQIWSELDGTMDRAMIRQALLDSATAYWTASFPTFVSIFVRRDALALLRERT